MNLEKNVIYPVGDMGNDEGLARELGCRAGTLPSNYLGPLWEAGDSQ